MNGLRLGTFAAIGTLAALQWATLLAGPPTARLLAVVATATALGWGLEWLRSRSGPGRWRGLRVAALVVAASGIALLVLGVPLGALVPWGWDRLADGIGDGLRDLGGQFDYPFDGAGEWARLLLVGAIVPLTIGAAVLTFRPGRDPDRVPVAGLVALIAAFAIPAVARPTAAPLLWGGALFALVSVWLWGPRMRTLPALALVAGFGVAAVPVASGLAADEPPLDYRAWSLPGPAHGISFNWEPTYGPIQWPRTGAVMFRVHAERPSYWRVAVLDQFYGAGWRRSGTGGPPVPAEPGPATRWVPRPGRTRSAWFSIRNLRSTLLMSPGTPIAFEDVDGGDRDRDGTTHVDREPLRRGSFYSAVAWSPDPRPSVLRSASRRYRRPLQPYTLLSLPRNASLEAIGAPDRIEVPLWGHNRGLEGSHRRLRRSAYARVAQLADRLTASSNSGYAAAVAIATHLRTAYAYDEHPPNRRLPLPAFLFRDRIGYCQQFSGAMALMLRMVGVPARVATGFAPGTPLSSGRGFEVTDLDAHSWVEVYFNGIGWVPFDPTPAIAPASTDIRGGAALASARIDRVSDSAAVSERTSGAHAAPPAPAGGDGGSSLPAVPLTAIAILLAAFAAVPPLRSLRHRRLPPEHAAAREVDELRRVLRSTGWAGRDAATLLSVEGRLRRDRRPAAASYVRGFRDRLYGPAAGPGRRSTLAERRSARRDLAAGSGLKERFRLLRAMPPGAPLRPR